MLEPVQDLLLLLGECALLFKLVIEAKIQVGLLHIPLILHELLNVRCLHRAVGEVEGLLPRQAFLLSLLVLFFHLQSEDELVLLLKDLLLGFHLLVVDGFLFIVPPHVVFDGGLLHALEQELLFETLPGSFKCGLDQLVIGFAHYNSFLHVKEDRIGLGLESRLEDCLPIKLCIAHARMLACCQPR